MLIRPKHLLALLALAVAFPALYLTQTHALTDGVDFNNSSDLTDNFYDDGTPVFTNQVDGGINNSGSVSVPVPSNDIWTTKQGYSVSGEAGSIYTFSAYFKVAQNSGYGNLGFTNSTNNTADSIGQPATGLGANFHGGGGAFVNNGVQTVLSWPPDLILGNWYWMTFIVETKGSNTFDLKLQIWNTDSTGVLGTMKTEKTQTGVVNNTLGSATTIHGFFSAAGSRMNRIDNFEIDLQGATFVEEGAPVVISNGSVTGITSSAAIFGGNVIDDKGASVTARGVCWHTSTGPTIANNCTTNGTGEGTFTSSITGLSPSTTYYVRSYATNSQGTSYGEEVSFTTEAGPAVDSDGIEDGIEDAAPNSGDANNDSIQDSLQSHVGSYLSSVTNNYVVLSYDSGDCTAISSMATGSETDYADDPYYVYSEGLLEFTLSGCTPGVTTTIIQYYYGAAETSNLLARKYNTINETYNSVPGASIQLVEIAGETVVRVQYDITDGGDLDMDGATNGTIVDPVGLALAAPASPNTGYQTQASYSFVPIMAVLLASLFVVGRQSRVAS